MPHWNDVFLGIVDLYYLHVRIQLKWISCEWFFDCSNHIHKRYSWSVSRFEYVFFAVNSYTRVYHTVKRNAFLKVFIHFCYAKPPRMWLHAIDHSVGIRMGQWGMVGGIICLVSSSNFHWWSCMIHLTTLLVPPVLTNLRVTLSAY